jgi:hypothetical protein
MEVGIGAFTRQGIEDRFGPDLPAGLEIALLFYVGRLRSGRGAPRLPSFLQNGVFEAAREEMSLSMGADIEEVLREEAKRQHTTVDRLVAHSVFLYLAELDRLESDGAAANEVCGA